MSPVHNLYSLLILFQLCLHSFDLLHLQVLTYSRRLHLQLRKENRGINLGLSYIPLSHKFIPTLTQYLFFLYSFNKRNDLFLSKIYPLFPLHSICSNCSTFCPTLSILYFKSLIVYSSSDLSCNELQLFF